MTQFMPARCVSIGGQKLEILSSGSRMKNPNFKYRDTQYFTIAADYETVKALVEADGGWSTIEYYNANSESLVPYNAAEIFRDDDGNVTGFAMEHDFSEFNILGDITIHNDGTATIEFGKPSELDETTAALDAMVYVALTE